MTAAPDGLVVVDKPPAMTSHDVVARVRRLAGTRKVGHAGTLDPMATGVLVVGVGRATRLLGHLALDEKAYDATIRLGESTLTDDAEGETTGGASTAGLTDDDIRAAVRVLTGALMQAPSSVSAIKVGGVRSYARVRAGEDVRLAPRPVTVSAFEVLVVRRPRPEVLDADVHVACSSGTYVRALARDLGIALGVGGHLTALRRTRAGHFDLTTARTLDQLQESFSVVPLSDAVASAFPRLDLDADQAADVAHGRRLSLTTAPAQPFGGDAVARPVGVFGPDGRVLALMAPRDGELRSLAVLVDPAGEGPDGPR